MRTKINYTISCLVIQLAIAYFLIRYTPVWFETYFDNIPFKFALLIVALIFVTNMAVMFYAYFFPVAAIKRTNMSWLICAWGGVAGLPATTGIYLIAELDVFGQEVLRVSPFEFGAASVFVTMMALGAMYVFNKEYNRLLEPQNVAWSCKTPEIS